jgi:6-phosphogluconolactonase (cycloisomerase 2 family)
MKFTKFGKALLMSALSAGVILSVTSCVQSYTVGYLYVTGTETSQSGGNGVISGFRIDHNTGKLTSIDGLPVSSGGANPGRAVLLSGSKFLYVLNRGVNAQGGTTCTTANPCQNANIEEFAVGGNGILTAQATFYTQGINPFRILVDGSGGYVYVLDHDAPDSNAYTGKNLTVNSCTEALGTATSCGDITAFSVNQTTGRLSTLQNNQVTSANCPNSQTTCPLTYFPVPADPIDFLFNSNYFFTLSGTSTTGDSVFPYTYNSSGQLTISQNTSQTLNIKQATAIVAGGGYIYVLDNEPITISTGGTGVFKDGTYSSQILPFSVGTGGALQAQTGGIVPDDATLSNPIYAIAESKGKWLYVANQGDNTNTTNAQSGIAGYVYDSSNHQLSFMADEPFGSGAGPQCMVEDPSDQFIYEADAYDSSVYGRVVDHNSGVLNNLRVGNTFSLPGPAAWCLVDGRTD